MAVSNYQVPSLSPIVLAGIALRPVPPMLFNPVMKYAIAAMKRRHPEVFERLRELGDPVYLVDPLDLPFVVLLRPNHNPPTLTVARDDGHLAATAVIRGPFLVLLDLLEGRVDGDALFFSRELTIEGDTEHVVALRNAVDSADIDLIAELFDTVGIPAVPAKVLTRGLGWLYRRAAADLDMLAAAVAAARRARSHRATNQIGIRAVIADDKEAA